MDSVAQASLRSDDVVIENKTQKVLKHDNINVHDNFANKQQKIENKKLNSANEMANTLGDAIKSGLTSLGSSLKAAFSGMKSGVQRDSIEDLQKTNTIK
ncbi:hypothetical protein HK096_000333, partial [Nowakowskiella sp. JEL0078]